MLDYFSDMWALAIDRQVRGVVFFIAVYAMLVLGYSFIYQCRIRAWPSTAGELLSVGTKKFGHAFHRADQQYKVSALYSYVVDGSRYSGKRVSPLVVVASHNVRAVLKMQLSAVQHLPDNNVLVFYNPKRPDKSYLIQPGVVSLTVTFILAVGPLAWYLLSYHA